MKDFLTEEDVQGFRAVFLTRLEELTSGRNSVSLCFSAGIDSSLVLFGLLELGKKPIAYTFHVEGLRSSDLVNAEKNCKLFGVEHRIITVPSSVDSIYLDVKRVIPYCAVIKKTVIECMRPWLYIYPSVEDSLLLNGLGGDDLYCNTRKLNVMLAKEGEEFMLRHRVSIANNLDNADANIMRFGKHYGIENIDVYDDNRIFSYSHKFKVKALNKPCEKALSVGAFADYFRRVGGYRPQSSFQINSGIASSHEQLLRSAYNTRNSKSVIAIYNDIAASI